MPARARCKSSYTDPLIVFGEKDNWNEIGPCMKYAEKLIKKGADIKIHTIKGAHHGFYKVREKKHYKVLGWQCEVTYDLSTMEGFNRRENKKVDLSKGWGNLWDDCSKKIKVTTQGTAATVKEAKKLTLNHLRDVFER